MSPDYKEYFPLLLFLLLALVSFLIIKPLLLALIIGTLLAYLFYPLYLKILKKVPHKTTVAILVCIIVILLLVIPSIFIVKTMVQESFALYALTKQKLATGFFRDCENTFCLYLKDFSKNPSITFQIQEFFKTATNIVIKKGSDFLISLPRLALNLIVVFFTMFYFLKDGQAFVQHINRYLSMKEGKYAFVLNRLKQIVHAIVHGYLLVAFIQGALGGLGFYLFGVSSPVFWGMVMGFLALIPTLGTGIIWIPASVLLFLDGLFQNSNILLFKGIGLFVYGLVIVGGIDNLLKPKIVGERAKVHPLVIILGTLGGLFFFGPLGVIIGPLVLSLVLLLMQVYLEKE